MCEQPCLSSVSLSSYIYIWENGNWCEKFSAYSFLVKYFWYKWQEKRVVMRGRNQVWQEWNRNKSRKGTVTIKRTTVADVCRLEWLAGVVLQVGWGDAKYQAQWCPYFPTKMGWIPDRTRIRLTNCAGIIGETLENWGP